MSEGLKVTPPPALGLPFLECSTRAHRYPPQLPSNPARILTPKKYQSGEKDVTGGITRTGDEMVRTALYEAANVLLSRITRFSKLKRWGMDVAKRRGAKRAKVALARKIAVILHRMWVDGTVYRWTGAEQIAGQA